MLGTGEATIPRRPGRIVAPGLALIAVTYGLARFAYGLFVPEFRESFGLSPSLLGVVGAGSYVGYCIAISISLTLTARTGLRLMAVIAGAVAVAGMGTVAAAPSAWILAVGILVAGSSTGLASPPMGEAVSRVVRVEGQDRANTLINSGTSVGVAISGPAALLTTGQWRIAWACFAAVGLLVLLWNLRAMPTRKGYGSGGVEEERTAEMPRLSCRYLFHARSLPLFMAAGGMGFASSVYWTFSRELVVSAGGLGETASTLFWMIIGVSGLAGAAAGDLVGRFGLASVLRVSLISMATAISLLALAPGVLAYVSAALFGSTYIMLTGIILVWSVAVFDDRPSAGLGAAFLLIAAGQAAGAPVAGALAGVAGIEVSFLAFAGLALLTATLKPRG